MMLKKRDKALQNKKQKKTVRNFLRNVGYSRLNKDDHETDHLLPMFLYMSRKT